MNARAQFLEHYGRIRAAEQRGSDESAFYRALPFPEGLVANTPLADQWRIRSATYRYFVGRLLPAAPCRILDLGAGNCWLSNRLAELGHSPTAVDIFRDSRDGLDAARHYARSFPRLEADFNHLPVAPASFDLAIFNASFHYSPDYVATLSEVRRCLKPRGRVIVLDTPIYKLPGHGIRMREERQQQFERLYGFRSEALASIEFLDEPALASLSTTLGITWEIHQPWYGWRWRLRPLVARLRRRRPPSRFWILSGSFE